MICKVRQREKSGENFQAVFPNGAASARFVGTAEVRVAEKVINAFNRELHEIHEQISQKYFRVFGVFRGY